MKKSSVTKSKLPALKVEEFRMALVDRAQLLRDELKSIHARKAAGENVTGDLVMLASRVGFLTAELSLKLAAYDMDETTRKLSGLIRRVTRKLQDAILQAQTSPTEPPASAEFLLLLVTSKKQRAGIIGDLAEQFHDDIQRGVNVNRAKLRYWGHVLATVKDQAWPAIKRLGIFALLTKLGS